MQLAPGGVLLLAGLAYAVFRQGAYHQAPHQTFAVIVALAAVVIAFKDDGRRALFGAGIVLAPLLLSTSISTIASADRTDAASTFLLIGLMVVGLAAAFTVRDASRSSAVDAVLFIGAIVGMTAIWGVATHTNPYGRVTEGVWRGSSSLTYANAAASVVGPMAVLAFNLASRRDSKVYAGVTTFMLAAFASTQSRGGALALLLFILATVVVLKPREFARTAVSVAVGTAIAAVPIVLTAPDSATARPAIVLVALCIGIAVTGSMFAVRDRFGHPGITLASLLVGGGVAAWMTGLGDSITERFTLRSGTTAGGEDAAVLFGDRAKEWSAAWEQFSEAPLVGKGPGVVDLTWVEQGRAFRALFVHNEYLELAVTHGIVGIAALAAGTYLFLRKRRASEVATPVALAVGTYAAHSTFDFLWHLPALPVLFVFLAGLAIRVDDT